MKKRFILPAIVLFSSISVFSQGILKGIVTDKADDSPLIAATVSLKGTTIGTVTGYNGEYCKH